MKESYSYIDILLSLREEYKKQNIGLEKLKRLTNVGARDVVDFHYWVYRPVSSINPELLCRVVNKKKAISNYTQDLLLLDNNGELQFKEDDLFIDDRNREEFNRTARKILDSSIARNMYSDIIRDTNTASIYSLQVKPSDIRTVVTKGIVKNTVINYCSYLDKLTIQDYPEELNKELLIYLLTLDFKRENIPEYFQGLLSEYDKTNTKVVLPRNLHEQGIVDFSLKDDGNKVYLRHI